MRRALVKEARGVMAAVHAVETHATLIDANTQARLAAVGRFTSCRTLGTRRPPLVGRFVRDAFLVENLMDG